MGIGLSLHLRSQPRGLLRRRKSAHELVPAFADALQERWLANFRELGPLVRRTSSEPEKLEIELHPAAEPVAIAVDGEHGVHVTARTNTPGPGYHAFLLETIEQLCESLDLLIQPGSDDDPIDETSFHADRDYSALQLEHARWLHSTCSLVVEKNYSTISLSMSIDTPTSIEGGILTAMGRFPIQWARAVSAQRAEDIGPFATEFFAWWERGAETECAYDIARVLLHDCPWHPPANDIERARMEVALDLLKWRDVGGRSFGHDSAADLRRELEALLAATPETAPLPRPNGFGFRRAWMRHRIMPGVDIDLPAYWYFTSAEEGKTAIAWFGSITVRVKCWNTSATDPDAVSAAHDARMETLHRDARRTFTFDVVEGRGDGSFQQSRDATDNCWMAYAFVSVPGRFVFATVAFDDEADEYTVERILRSCRAQPTTA